ncbi:MAG: hypothetical protein ACR2J3_02240, partial [Aridibacter sp.]
MWKDSDLGQRINYGVVVKAKKITGNAETNTGAMNVLNQIRQMLKTPYLNPVNGKSEEIRRCYVACSKDIAKEAMNSIEGELENNLGKLVEWIHPGTNLFDLIEKYLPEQDMLEKLSSIQKDLDERTKLVPYRLVADSTQKISILAKHEGASEELPFIVETGFKFHSTPGGKEELEKINELFKKGLPVEIDGKFIDYVNLPDFLPELMKPQTMEGGKLILQPNRSEYSIPLYFERKLATGELIDSNILHFEIVQPGTEEQTLKNDKQKTPLQAALTINLEKQTLKFVFTYQFYGFNVFEHLEGLKFFNSMYKDGETTIYRADTGIKIIDSQKNKIEVKENFDKNIELLEALFLIQEKTSILLDLFEHGLANENINDVFRAAEIIKSGKLSGTMPEIKTDVSLESAKDALKTFENEAINYLVVSHSDGWTYNILGNEINLGVAVLTANVFITKIDFHKIEKDIAEGKNTIEFCFKPKDESVIIDFLKWDCEDR